MFTGLKNVFGINSAWKNKYGTKILLPLILFLIAFLPRVASLGTVLTADQDIWITRSLAFFNAIMQHDWANTLQTSHPGVTTMWLSGISLGLFYKEGMDFVQQLFIAQFPMALTTSIGIVLIYYFVKKIFNIKIAIFSALFLASEPYYIANSRVIHLDAMLSTFMVLSVLSLLVHLNDPDKKYYLIFSGIFAGLALLTKLPAIFLILFIPFTIIFWHLSNTFKLYKTIKTILIVFVISSVIFFILWPFMWIEPISAINNLLGVAQGVRTSTIMTGFYMGEITNTGNLGWSYYPVILFMRLSPVTLLFSLICIIYLVINIKKHGFTNSNKNVSFLLLYIILFIIQMTLSAKKGDRYLLPVFPACDIIASVGLFFIIDTITERLPSLYHDNAYIKTSSFRDVLNAFIMISALLFQAGSSLPLHPYYFSYNSPIFGGSSHASELFLFGGGEGMDIAAKYLNEKSDSINLTVAADYNGFEPLFKGKTVGMDNVSSADYIVFYISSRQRNYAQDIWERYKNETPEKLITINDMNYAWVYKTKVEISK